MKYISILVFSKWPPNSKMAENIVIILFSLHIFEYYHGNFLYRPRLDV